MMDLPPPTEPATVEVQKINQKEELIQKIKKLCEKSTHLTNNETENLCDLCGRAYFLDICNTSNAKEIFSFKIASCFINGCSDGFVPQATSNYTLNQYHIKEDDIWKLQALLSETGKDENTFLSFPLEECRNTIFDAIYTIMIRNPDFTPKFTTFTFGGTLGDLPPLRDKDGNPNMEFFRAWKQKTEAKYSK